MKGICHLCQQEATLKNSHIIPEFVYKPLYDEKHRFDLLSNIPTKGPAKLQKGVRERLLCEDCESKLSKHERYMSLILSGQKQVDHFREGKLVHLEGLDYKHVRLFALSILWRASISSLQIFEQVKLGPHEDTIRVMILNEDPSKPDTYPFMMCPIVYEDKVQTDLILQPTWTRADGHYGYRFVFAGLAWIYLVSSHKVPRVFAEVSVSEIGKMTMLISSIENMPFITNLAREIKESGNLQE